MSDAPTLSPDVSRSVLALARTPVVVARSWALYPVVEAVDPAPAGIDPLKYM